MSDLKNDIEKYLQGDLTPVEMHRIEKEALRDPFLAEALEGGSSLSGKDFSTDMKTLKQALQNRIERKTISLWWWSARIAAGFIILAVTGYIVFSVIETNAPKSNLALNKNASSETPSAIKESPTPSSPSPVITPERDHEIHKSTEPTYEKRIAQEETGSDDALLEEKVPAKTQQEVITQHEHVETNNVAGEVSEEIQTKEEAQSAVEDSPEPQADKLMKPETESKRKASTLASYGTAAAPSKMRMNKKPLKVLQGKVIDEDGSPMPGVSVTLKGSDIGTVTDGEGNYKLALDRDPKGELIFSFIGMQSAEVPIGKDSIDAKLSPDFAELSEVVVIGYSSAKDDDIVTEDANVYQPASPDGGKKAYKNYLRENLKYPQQAVEDKVQGKVTVQFMIETNGNLNDFRVIKGIGHGCDDEVIRLIKQGPKWMPTKHNDVPTKGKVKVRLKFTLPE